MHKTITVILTATLAAAIGCGGRETAVKSDTGSKSSPPKVASSSSAAPAGTRGNAPVATAEETAADTSVGQMMPRYSTLLLDGGKIDLAEEKGNVVLLNLWATWCIPCRAEIPELERLHQQHAGDKFKVVGVSVDEAGVKEVQDFAKEQRMTYPIALDPEGKLANLFQTTVLPTSVLIDRQGRIVWKKYGQVSLTDKDLQEALAKALKG